MGKAKRAHPSVTINEMVGTAKSAFATLQFVRFISNAPSTPSLRGALATKQSSAARGALDCFVASAPRNDGEAYFRILATAFVRGLPFRSPPKPRGRREDRVRAAPAVSCAMMHRKCAHEHTGEAEAVRPSLRNGFTAYIVLSLVTGLSCHHRRADTSARLERQRRGVRTTRLRRARSITRLVTRRAHRSPRPTFRDGRHAPLASTG